MKIEIYNIEGIEIEIERTSKDDTEAESRKMAYAFKMIREKSGMNCKDFFVWLGSYRHLWSYYRSLLYILFDRGRD